MQEQAETTKGFTTAASGYSGVGILLQRAALSSSPPCITTTSVDKEPTYFLDLLRPTNDIAQLYKTRPCCPQLLLEKRVSQNKVNGKELGLTGGLWSTTRGFQIPCFQTYSNLRRKRHYYYYLRGKEMSIVPEMRVMVLMQATIFKADYNTGTLPLSV